MEATPHTGNLGPNNGGTLKPPRMPPKAAAKGAALTKKPSYMDKIQVSICQIACLFLSLCQGAHGAVISQTTLGPCS